ncbi:hypothetical protein HK104_004479, partial [Borealophlyctis nickersoniae]
ILINRLHVLRDEVANATATVVGLSASNQSPQSDVDDAKAKQRRLQEEEKSAVDEFRQFLRTYKVRERLGGTGLRRRQKFLP